jgi:hypothetical protein
MDSGAGTPWVLAGSAIFLVGAAIGVPRVFSESDPAARLRLLEDRLVVWRVAQPFYAIGPLVAPIGVGVLAATVSDEAARLWLMLACLLLVAGAVSWSWAVYLRFRHVREFALGELPGWPFTVYLWLTFAGLASLGTGLLIAGLPAWSGWLTLTALLAFLLFYLRVRDLPPFVFYVLLPLVSLGWL